MIITDEEVEAALHDAGLFFICGDFNEELNKSSAFDNAQTWLAMYSGKVGLCLHDAPFGILPGVAHDELKTELFEQVAVNSRKLIHEGGVVAIFTTAYSFGKWHDALQTAQLLPEADPLVFVNDQKSLIKRRRKYGHTGAALHMVLVRRKHRRLSCAVTSFLGPQALCGFRGHSERVGE